MKIAVFTDAYLGASGGIPAVERAQATELRRLGHEVVIFSPGKATDEENVVVLPSHWWKINGVNVAKNPKKILKFVLKEFPDFRERFDIVHVHYEGAASIGGMYVARECGLPLVQTMHGREDAGLEAMFPLGLRTLAATMLNLWHRHYIKHSVRVKRDKDLATTRARAKMWSFMINHANYADVVITPAKHFQEKFLRYGCAKPVVQVSNAVEDEIVKKHWKTRKYNGGELRILWNSRLAPEKRAMEFLEAVRIAVSEGAKVKVEMYGGGSDYKKAARFVSVHGLNDIVKMHGSTGRDEILKGIQEMHLSALMSYDFDDQPMTMLEAEATGLPVLFCDPDLAEVVAKDGAICASGPEPRAVADAILEIYAHPEKIEKMSQVMMKNRNEICQSECIKQLLKVYQQATK